MNEEEMLVKQMEEAIRWFLALVLVSVIYGCSGIPCHAWNCLRGGAHL